LRKCKLSVSAKIDFFSLFHNCVKQRIFIMCMVSCIMKC
jgi:hypothetical protein